MIQLRNPCQALKFGPCRDFSEVSGSSKVKCEEQKNPNHGNQRQEAFKPSLVRSPLNMTSNLESDVQNEEFMKPGSDCSRDDGAQVNYETLTNYWNKNQVIRLAGVASKAHLDTFVKTLQRLNPIAKVFQSDQGLEDLGINQLDLPETGRELRSVRRRGLNFSEQLNKMRPSLRFSILALLSANKFNIFNQGLIDFMEMLNNGGWNGAETTADFGAYIIDQINLFEELDYKDDSSQNI